MLQIFQPPCEQEQERPWLRCLPNGLWTWTWTPRPCHSPQVARTECS